MVYCVSDIHGELDKFERLLQLIRFSDADQMYILEDVIDRGVMGVDILQRIMGRAQHDHAPGQPRADVLGYPGAPW